MLCNRLLSSIFLSRSRRGSLVTLIYKFCDKIKKKMEELNSMGQTSLNNTLSSLNSFMRQPTNEKTIDPLLWYIALKDKDHRIVDKLKGYISTILGEYKHELPNIEKEFRQLLFDERSIKAKPTQGASGVKGWKNVKNLVIKGDKRLQRAAMMHISFYGDNKRHHFFQPLISQREQVELDFLYKSPYRTIFLDWAKKKKEEEEETKKKGGSPAKSSTTTAKPPTKVGAQAGQQRQRGQEAAGGGGLKTSNKQSVPSRPLPKGTISI